MATVCSLPSSIEIKAGARAPECYEILVDNDALDWRTVTAASAAIDWEAGSGRTDETHALTIVGATATTATLRHVFDSAGVEAALAEGSSPISGRLKISLTVPGGTVRLAAIMFTLAPW